MKRIIIVGLACVLLQSCGLFKGGKGKCNDCPTWGKVEETEQKVKV